MERIPRVKRQLAPIKPIRKTDGTTDGDVTILERDEKVFDTSGYELHLVETLERDILQKNPDVRWRDVIGLDDAKAVLQEAMVLPLVMPDYFKVRFVIKTLNGFCETNLAIAIVHFNFTFVTMSLQYLA